MNVYLHELKAYQKSTLVWMFSLITIIILFLSFFPTFSNDAADFKRLLEGYPEAVRKAVGISIESITTFLGFYSYIFTYILLCGSIQAMNLGTSILSKEVREKTADFLLTKPITRSQIITAKLFAALTCLVITNLAFLVSASIMAIVVSNSAVEWKPLLLISITALFVQLMFLALGMFVSVTVSKIKSVLPISLSTVFFFYFISMFGSVIGDDFIRYVTPFKYYDTAYIIEHSAYEPTFIFIELVFIVAAVFGSYSIYLKKDIHSV